MTHTNRASDALHLPAPIRTLQAGEWKAYRAIRLRSLADAPDAFGSTLAEEQNRLPELWAARLIAAAVSGKDYPLIAQDGARAVGMLWAKVDPDDDSIVNIYQVWVAPESRGQGLAAAMLRAAVAWARSNNARAVRLGVTCGDTPAARLYAREGFIPVGSPTARRATSPLLEQSMQLTLV